MDLEELTYRMVRISPVPLSYMNVKNVLQGHYSHLPPNVREMIVEKRDALQVYSEPVTEAVIKNIRKVLRQRGNGFDETCCREICLSLNTAKDLAHIKQTGNWLLRKESPAVALFLTQLALLHKGFEIKAMGWDYTVATNSLLSKEANFDVIFEHFIIESVSL